MTFCKRCYTEFKRDWYRQHPGEAFNVNMEDLIFKCQLPLFDHNGYGDPIVNVFNCVTKSYEVYSNSDWNKRKNCGMKSGCKDSCTSCKKVDDGKA